MIRDAQIIDNNRPYYTIEFYVDDAKYTQTIISNLENDELIEFIQSYIEMYAQQLESLN